MDKRVGKITQKIIMIIGILTLFIVVFFTDILLFKILLIFLTISITNICAYKWLVLYKDMFYPFKVIIRTFRKIYSRLKL